MKRADLIRIANDFGSPVYVYDSEKMIHQYTRLTSAFDKVEKLSAVVINTARSGCINEEDLLNAFKERQITGACLDVFMNEPEPDRRLLNNSRVIATPHIAGSTREAQAKIGLELVDQLLSFV